MSALPANAPRWIVWKSVKSKTGARPKKVPIDFRTGEPIDSNSIEHCATLDKLPPKVRRGFVMGKLPERDAMLGFDLDSCRDKSGKLAPWADEMLRAVGSYAEVSPGKDGVKIFALVDDATFDEVRKLIGDHKKTWNFGSGEHAPGVMIMASGFFTVTGNAIDKTQLNRIGLADVKCVIAIAERMQARVEGETGDKAETRSDVLHRLARKAVYDMERDEFADAILDCDADALGCPPEEVEAAAAHVNDQDDGDRALDRPWVKARIMKLARQMKAAGKPHSDFVRSVNRIPQIDRLGESEKAQCCKREWEAAPSGASLLDNLGDEAGGIAPKGSALRFYEPKEFDPLKPKLDIVRGLLFENSVGLLFGPSNCGKTFAGLYLLVAVASGQKAFDRETEQRVCLYIGLEGESSIKTRIWAAMNASGLEEQPLHYALGALDILDDRQLDALIARAAEIKAGFIVIDTLSQAVTGVDTNEMAAMSRVIGALHRIKRQTGACVLGIAHRSKKTPNAKGPIGSYVQQMNADTLLEVVVEGDPDIPLHTSRRFLTAVKQRDGENGAKFVFGLKQMKTPYLDARDQPIETLTVKDGLEHFDNLDAEPDTARLSDREREALAVFRRLDAIAFATGPVTRDHWRDALGRLKTATWPKDKDARRMATGRAVDSLIAKKLVTIGGEPMVMQ